MQNNDNWVVCDPGKRVLLYMENKNWVRFRYSNKEHLHKTKQVKYQKLIQNYKNKNEISVLEAELTSFNSKSCVYALFETYVKKKIDLNRILMEKYENKIFRQYKWYGYINRQKSETLHKNDNMYLPDKKGMIRKMHSILTYKLVVKEKDVLIGTIMP